MPARAATASGWIWRTRRGSFLDAITLVAARGDEFRAELFADAENVDVHQVGKRVVAFVQQMLVKRGARNDFAAMHREVFVNGILARRDRDGQAGAGDGAGAGVNQ